MDRGARQAPSVDRSAPGKDASGVRSARDLILAAGLFVALVAGAQASALGSSGGLSVPDPETLAPEQYQLELYGELFDETNLNTGALDNTANLTFVLNVGVYDNFELGMRRVARLNSPVQGESFQLTGKYRFPVDTYNVTIGGVLSTSGSDWSSLYVVAGWKALWLGFGYNFGGDRIREFTRNRLTSVGTASFGGYSVRTARNGFGQEVVTGNPDPIFGLFGVNLKLSEHLRALADFDGDRFTGGVRLMMKDIKVDLSYVSQKERDSLFDRQSQNFQLGVGAEF